MVIRCERCSTLYELDEKLLSASGSQVQCTRCQHVFTARPPSAPGRTLVGVPAQPGSPPPAAPQPLGARPPAPTSSSNGSARAVRSGPPPVYRPTPPAQGAPGPGAAAVRAPLLRKDTVGAFESRLRWSARWRWLGPLAVAIAIAGGGGAWLLLSGRVDPETARARQEALALIARDDAESVGKAIARLEGVAGGAQTPMVEADRALAKVVRAAGLVEEGEASPGVAREREAEARALATEAYEALRSLQAGEGGGAEVARALAAYYALGGDRERAQRAIRGGAERAPADPWLVLADAWLDAGGTDRAARERALVKLGGLSASHPELIRARWLLARTQASLGRRSEAISTLEGLLSANGRHEGARRLRSELTGGAMPDPAAPPTTATPEPAPAAATAPALTTTAPPRRRPPPAPAPEAAPATASATAPATGAETNGLPPQVLTPATPPAPEPAAAPPPAAEPPAEAKPPPADPPPRPKRQPPPEPPPLEGQ